MADLDAVFLQPLANVITLACLVYYSSVDVGKLAKMSGYQVVDRRLVHCRMFLNL